MAQDITLIIGNGFDLDLGLQTRYSDFVQSHEFQDILARNEVASKLNADFKKKLWSDLEDELRNYSTDKYEQLSKQMKEIRFALKQYITRQILDDVEMCTTCFAYKFIHEAFNQHINICTFNYSKTIELINKEVKVIHVHRSVTDRDIILGINQNSGVPDTFLLKADQRGYKRTITNRWLQSKKVIIFGHSLGITDWDYFNPLFDAVQNGRISAIHIITKDDIAICRNLEKYYHADSLLNHQIFIHIPTSKGLDNNYTQILKNLWELVLLR